MEFAGLPIIVSSFTPYKMLTRQNLFFLTIKPEETLLKTKVNPQYFVVVDMKNAKAFECLPAESTEPWIFISVFFITETRFIGQRSISPTSYEYCEYEIIMPENENDPWRIARNDSSLCLTAKGITAVAYEQ